MTRHVRMLPGLLVVMVALIVGAAVSQARAAEFAEARIFFEYNSTDNDLGVHVSLDGEDWRTLQIVHPDTQTIFEVTVTGGFNTFGLTEMFFEGAEPSLDEVPLAELLSLFPEGEYTFIGTTVDGTPLEGTAVLSHAVPAGPEVTATVDGGEVTIEWEAPNGPPEGFPARPISIVGYQVLVDSFQVTLPASSRSVKLPEEFVRSLRPGTHAFEVLAIEASGNQTITEDTFTVPFADVPEGHFAEAFIYALVSAGVTSGCGTDPPTYCPEDLVTREQLPSLLLKAKLGPDYVPPPCTTALFADVACSSLFAPWIQDLVVRGVTAGCGAGNYCPGSPVTQEQIAVFLLKTLEGPAFTPGPCVAPVFADVPCSSPFAPWIQELFNRGIAAGCGAGLYCPADPVTRARIAVLLVKTFNLPL